ncbi:hypothetical protein Van01_03150 [Micromonospora andamanensis]|uniref:Uncharacterized protein n=1 Tax=Micromonospora andamanensis TaxID=1287068 RepID=A0ABQ4HNK2_9ACTN|nr:hypothetical protein Van01_03150 [Micromonospora andamanensis]
MSVVPRVVVLSGGSFNRQVTSVAVDPPGRTTRPPSLTVVTETPWGSSWRTVVSTGVLPALRTSIRYRGATLCSGATRTLTFGLAAGEATRVGVGTAGGAAGMLGSGVAAAGWSRPAVGAAGAVAVGVAGTVAAGSTGRAVSRPMQCTIAARALWCRVDAGIRTNLRSRR